MTSPNQKDAAVTGTTGLKGAGAPPGIRPEWAHYYQRLMELRDRLLETRAQQLRTAADPLEPHSMHLADTATDEFDRDLNLAELASEQDFLYELEEALRRIIDGTYGICELTGKPISPARLGAVPWTRFSQRAESWLEKNEHILRPPHLGRVLAMAEPVGTRFEEVEDTEEELTQPLAEDEKLEILPAPRSLRMHPKRPKNPPAG